MKKTGLGGKIRALLKGRGIDEGFFEELEDILIEGDIGSAATMEISDELKEEVKKRRIDDPDEVQRMLGEIISSHLEVEEDILPEGGDLSLFLVLGVNGVGKTTTIAKLADYLHVHRSIDKKDIVLSAGDTFRAAAIDQLQLHGKRLGVKVVAQEPGADPGAVIFDSIESAKAGKARVILADTAGRMHNKANLIKELQKIDKIISNRLPPGGIYRKILIIDATTGQNGLRQAEIFNEAVAVDSVILAKYDSTSKGGIAVTISKRMGLPFSFLGVGEKYEDLHPFTKEEYVSLLLGRS
ncbi:MAG: signal recognition particle-docking protein FtsY [Spirochaetota bacterium]